MQGIILNITIKGIPIKIHWSILIIAFWSVLNLNTPVFILINFLTAIFIILIHEIGHALIIKILKYKLEAIVVNFWGGFCTHEAVYYEREDVLIASGGVLAQLVLCVFSVTVLGILSLNNYYNIYLNHILLYRLILHNIVIVIINLIPFRGFDGELIIPFIINKFKITKSKSIKIKKPKKVKKDINEKRVKRETGKLVNNIIKKARKQSK